MSVEESTLSRNDVKVFGSGYQPMLMARRYGCDQNLGRHIAPAFVDDYRVVQYDHVGHGASDATQSDEARYHTLHGHANDLLQAAARWIWKSSSSSDTALAR